MIFYSLISEEKNKKLKLHGPFIHYKVDDRGDYIYLFEKENYMKEKQYLSKILREKSALKVPIYHFVGCEHDPVNCVCDKCENRFQVNVDRAGSVVVCNSCSNEFEAPNISKTFETIRRQAMFDAEEFFEKKFDNLKENYAICMRSK